MVLCVRRGGPRCRSTSRNRRQFPRRVRLETLSPPKGERVSLRLPSFTSIFTSPPTAVSFSLRTCRYTRIHIHTYTRYTYIRAYIREGHSRWYIPVADMYRSRASRTFSTFMYTCICTCTYILYVYIYINIYIRLHTHRQSMYICRALYPAK